MPKGKTGKKHQSTHEGHGGAATYQDMSAQMRAMELEYKNNHGREKANITHALLDLWLAYRDEAKEKPMEKVRGVFMRTAQKQAFAEEKQRLANVGNIVKNVRTRFYNEAECDVVCAALTDIFERETRPDFKEKIKKAMKEVNCNIEKITRVKR